MTQTQKSWFEDSDKVNRLQEIINDPVFKEAIKIIEAASGVNQLAQGHFRGSLATEAQYILGVDVGKTALLNQLQNLATHRENEKTPNIQPNYRA